MRKYLYCYKLSLKVAYYYRLNAIVTLLFNNISFIITIFFWKLIYGGNESSILNGFDFSKVVTYYLIHNLFYFFVFYDVGISFVDLIKSGGFTSYLLKPYRLTAMIYVRHFADKSMDFLSQVIIVILTLPALGKFLVINLNWLNAVYILIFIVLSTVTSFLVGSMLGGTSFWIEDAKWVIWTFQVLLNFLTGVFIPVDFFPQKVIPILEWLPFMTWGYIPTKIYLGFYSLDKIHFLLLINIMWTFLLFLIYEVVLKFGIKNYMSVGG